MNFRHLAPHHDVAQHKQTIYSGAAYATFTMERQRRGILHVHCSLSLIL